MSRVWPALLLCAVMLLPLPPAAAQQLSGNERVHSYAVHMRLLADGNLEVDEHVLVEAHGGLVRRGLFRDFPTRYRDRFGNRVEVDFQVLGLQRDGAPEPYFTESRSNGVRVNFGTDELLPVPGLFHYVLRYRTRHQVGFFDDHDELYFNVIGSGWEFPIDAAEASLTLPQPLAGEQLTAECWVGPEGSHERNCSTQISGPGQASWRASRGLQPGEAFTVVLGFPKGVIAEPSAAQRQARFLRQNAGVGVGLLSLLLMLGWCAWRWLRLGRDPLPGPVFPRYQPPRGFGPSVVAKLRGRGDGNRGLAADVLALAIHGWLDIERVPRKLLTAEHWLLTDTRRVTGADVGSAGAADTGQGRLDWLPPSTPPSPTPEQRVLHAKLFASGSRLELKPSQAPRLQEAAAAHARQVQQQLGARYYRHNAREMLIAGLIGLPLAVATLWIGGPHGLPLRIVLVVMMFLTWLAFVALIGAPTAEGRALRDEIEGFLLYLGVAERDELARTPMPDQNAEAPTVDADRYKALLPFAVALGVENQWTDKFSRSVGAAMAERVVAGIPGLAASSGRGGIGGASGLVQDFSRSLSGGIAAASTPPGSSSGLGGGGFAGGGGGGGGGGGR